MHHATLLGHEPFSEPNTLHCHPLRAHLFHVEELSPLHLAVHELHGTRAAHAALEDATPDVTNGVAVPKREEFLQCRVRLSFWDSDLLR